MIMNDKVIPENLVVVYINILNLLKILKKLNIPNICINQLRLQN